MSYFEIGERVENICKCGCLDEEGQQFGVIKKKFPGSGNYVIKFDNGSLGNGYDKHQLRKISTVPQELFEL